MTEPVMRDVIQVSLNTVTFTGLTVDYCTALRDAIRPQLPGVVLEAFYRGRELVVDARHGKVVCCVKLQLPG